MTNTNTQQFILEKLHFLPPDKQQELLDFAEFLVQKNKPKQKRRSIEGLCADLNVHITEADIAEARREMWGSIPMITTKISKSELEQFFQELPDIIDIEKIMGRLYVLQKIHAGETDLKKGHTLLHNQVIKRLSKKWPN
jgi:hypothetical protein